ncbi:type II toxin-antitoxin system ParD family antitoxin [Mesorhizobium sp. VK9D]|nr:type II toxin-antitoxin system ParD family antitoxin [Mesorhizobium sp. VK9D]MDX8456535.1 type II toxin-antitoxin system ParD family antitoxin [Mesorhizobium sp. VK9D]
MRLERLRKAIDEGDRSGEPEPFDFECFYRNEETSA